MGPGPGAEVPGLGLRVAHVGRLSGPRPDEERAASAPRLLVGPVGRPRPHGPLAVGRPRPASRRPRAAGSEDAPTPKLRDPGGKYPSVHYPSSYVRALDPIHHYPGGRRKSKCEEYRMDLC